MSAERLNRLLDAFEDAWCGRDQEAFAASCSHELHYEDPFCGEPIDGPKALGKHARRLWQAFPDARMERGGERLTDGRFVAAPVKLVGTNGGELDGLPASKKFVVVHAVLYCELDGAGEKLFRVRAFCDAYDAALQLGLVPKPGTLGARALSVLQGFGLNPRR